MADRETTVRLSVADNFSTQLRAFARALDQSEQATQKLSTSQKLLKTASQGATDLMMGLGVSLPTSPMMALGEAIKFSVGAAIEQEQAMAKTEAVVKSTGGAAGYTAEEIAAMAGRMAQLTGVNDETIQSAENVMLTFTAIGHETFPQAMDAALNMSAALGQDLQTSVIQVGKALQDPINGMTALRRVGVNFNDDAKKTVKAFIDMGDTAGAQAFILKELKTEFGGMAEAAGNTTVGAINKLKVSIENIGETVGRKFTPILKDAAETLDLLINGADKINEAFEGTRTQIEKNSKSYGEYRSALIATAVAAGKLTQEQANQILAEQRVYEAGYRHKDLTDELTTSIGLMSDATYEAVAASRGEVQETRYLAKALPTAVDATQELTQAQRDLNASLIDAAISTSDLTTRELYMDAIKDLPIGSQLELGRALGLVNEQNYNVMKSLQAAQAEYQKTGDIKAYTKSVYELNQQLNAIKTDIQIRISLSAPNAGDIPNMGNPGGKAPAAPAPKAPAPKAPAKPPKKGGPQAAGGADFVVPAGYANDSYPVFTSSGERVKVTPKGGGDGNNYITINVNGVGDPNAVAQKVSQVLAQKLRGLRGNPSYAGI